MMETGRPGRPVRQGDILLIPVATLPEAPVLPARGGAVILAEGEATGHCHYVSDLEAALLDANDAMRAYAAEQGAREPGLLVGGLRVGTATTLWHGTPVRDPAGPRDADHDPITLPAGDYLVLRPREYVDEDEFRLIAD